MHKGFYFGGYFVPKINRTGVLTLICASVNTDTQVWVWWRLSTCLYQQRLEACVSCLRDSCFSWLSVECLLSPAHIQWSGSELLLLEFFLSISSKHFKYSSGSCWQSNLEDIYFSDEALRGYHRTRLFWCFICFFSVVFVLSISTKNMAYSWIYCVHQWNADSWVVVVYLPWS